MFRETNVPHLATIWNRVLESLTMRFVACVSAFSMLLEITPQLAEALPILQPYVPPDWLGRYTMALNVLFFLARMRSILHVVGGDNADKAV